MAVLGELRKRVRGAEPELPPLRVGVAFGGATPRAGGWFTSAVNVASRMAEAYEPER